MSYKALAASILANSVFSKEASRAVATKAASSAQQFALLMQCFLSEDSRLIQRSAWCVSQAARLAPDLIKPYIPQLVQQLQRPDASGTVIRNCARILEETEIPEAFHGPVMNTCFQLVTTPGTAVAIKAFSLTILYNLSSGYPDILPELQLIIEEQWETETAAFRSRGKKILAGIQKQKR
ncbi:hypothetical protein SAMN05421788_106140 [Filimonas lacunae]|uniref:HEAT repeat-containing protein n=1 Tax=Filimonas lacunae TaxID=477680 RepID=A0A173MEP7_9BACT|nr:hypothetical protein [Filimonas lacunae]BAV06072.1 hypothetical protein FLA_2087 [Filimonas lacunae]SIT24532.1 hypothetical protein SAMN05421788_106140 [Filimonas lacunae]